MSADSTFHIRDARPDERLAIRELTLAAYAEHAQVMTPSSWAGLHAAVLAGLETDAPAERIVAVRDGALLGSVMLFPPENHGYGEGSADAPWPELRLLAVAPNARGQGVGKALVKECMRRARQTGATALGLHSSDSLSVAVQMYQRMGFARVPEGDFQPEGAELVKAYRLELR